MFNFKTRKELKEEVASLEKQLGYAEEIASDERKENLKLRDELATKEYMDGELRKSIKRLNERLDEAKYCNETLTSGFERVEEENEELKKENKGLKEYKKLHEELEKFWEWKFDEVWEKLAREDRKIHQLREERRRNQANHEKYIKQLKKEKAEIKHELEDEIKTSDSLSWELRDQLEYFPANGFELELDELCKVGRREYYCDLGKPWAEEILNQMDEKLAEKDEEIAKKDKKIEKLQGFLKYEQKETERLKVDLKVAKHDLRQLEAISLKRLEDRNYWRDKNSKQWAERTRTAKHLEIARKQLRREQELRERDQQKLRGEKLRLKMDLKKAIGIINFLKERLKIAKDYGKELKNDIERLEESTNETINFLRKKLDSEESYGEGLRNKIKKLEYENKRLEKKQRNIDRNMDERDVLEKDVEILEEKLGKQMEVYYKAKGTIGLREYEAEKAYRKMEQLRKERRRSQENYGKYIKKLKKDKVKLKLKLKEKEETIYNFCLMENKVSDRLGFELRKANEENKMLRNENEENKKLIKELEVKNSKGAEWLLSKEEERKLREELSNLRSQLEEKEEEVTRLAIDSDKVKVKQEKELTKATEEKIQLAIEKQEALDKMEKLLQDNKRKRNYANGLGKINKVVKIVRHKK